MADKNKVKFGEMNKNELNKFIEEQKTKSTKLRFDISSKQIKNHREYRNTKRNIARALTAMNTEIAG